MRTPVAAGRIGDGEQGRSHSRACGCACSTRTPSSARSPTPRFTPAQADAITNAVRLAAEHGDHVPLDQFTASLAEVRAEIAEVRTEIAAALKRPSPSRQPTPCQVHVLEEAPACGSLSSRTGSRVVVDSTGCPLIPTQARPPPRWGTTRGVWSTGARSPRALGTCDSHDLSVAPGRPPRSWPSPSPVRRPPPPGRRPPAPGSPPSEPAHHRHAVRRSVVGARRAPRARDHGVEPIALERDLFSDSTPTARHAAAVTGDEDGGQVSRPRTVSPRPASTSAARPGDAALHEPHVPRPRPPGSSCRAGR